MRIGTFLEPCVSRAESCFVERIRPDVPFDSLDDLIAQMRIDKAQAREILAGGGRLMG